MEVIIPVGYSFFERNMFNDSKLQKLLTIKRKSTLYQKEKWKIYDDNFDKNWALIFSRMRQSQAIILELDSNRYPKIAECLFLVNFSRLKHLNLQNNEITNIEKLYVSCWPELQELYLGNNRICCLRALRKNWFQKLQYLSLVNNPVTDIESLTLFSNRHLSKVNLQWEDGKVIGECGVWLAKIGSIAIKYLRVQSSKRIKQNKINQMLMGRHGEMMIWTVGAETK